MLSAKCTQEQLRNNNTKISFKKPFSKTALKPPSIKATLTYKIHRLKRVNSKMRSKPGQHNQH